MVLHMWPAVLHHQTMDSRNACLLLEGDAMHVHCLLLEGATMLVSFCF